MIPFARPKDRYLAHRDALTKAFTRVMESGVYIQGPEVARFEGRFAQAMGAEEAIGVASGTDAITLGLKALALGPGDEVLCPSHTASATVAAIELTGATPVFVDIEEPWMTLDPISVEGALTPRTRAVVAVHLYGQCADMEKLLARTTARGLHLVEDCAQAHGARYRQHRVGTLGVLGFFSFYPTKNLGAFGDGGAILSRKGPVADKLRAMREYGWTERYHSHFPGANSRLDELQAALLDVGLDHLEGETAERQRQAATYLRELQGLPLRCPQTRPGCSHVFHLFVIRTPDRDRLMAHLRAKGIGASLHYPLACHQQGAYLGLPRSRTGLPVTETVMKEILTLPLFPGLTESEQGQIIDGLKSFYR